MEKHKLVIIGSGPAGYTAGVYAARAELKPVIYTGVESGGQLMYTTEVENFPGFAKGIMGPKLMMEMREQAQRFGAEIKDALITAVDFSARPFKLWTDLPEGVAPDIFKTGSTEDVQKITEQVKKELKPTMEAESVIISTGAVSIRLNVPGESEFFGKGVSSCAVCDAAFFRDKTTYVIGGGDSAIEDAMALTKFAKEVFIIHRRDKFRASKVMADRALNNKKIKVLWNTSLEEVAGDDTVKSIKVKTPEGVKEYKADGVFLAIGHRPMTDILAGQIDRDSHNYVITRQSLSKEGLDQATKALSDDGLVEYPSMTSVPGVFAAGDVVDVRYKQAVTAAGQGCAAALDAERWLEGQEQVKSK